jgi:hypothetical protein
MSRWILQKKHGNNADTKTENFYSPKYNHGGRSSFNYRLSRNARTEMSFFKAASNV